MSNLKKIIQEELSKFFVQEIIDLIHEKETTLPDPAKHAIDNFVGIEYGRQSEFGVEFMSEGYLEDAYSDTPGDRDKLTRSQLQNYFNPIRDKLREIFGNTMTIFRFQTDKKDKNKRHVLSYTMDFNVAKFFSIRWGNKGKILGLEIPIDDIIWITDRMNQMEVIVYNRNYDDGEDLSVYAKNITKAKRLQILNDNSIAVKISIYSPSVFEDYGEDEKGNYRHEFSEERFNKFKSIINNIIDITKEVDDIGATDEYYFYGFLKKNVIFESSQHNDEKETYNYINGDIDIDYQGLLEDEKARYVVSYTLLWKKSKNFEENIKILE